MYKTSGTTVVGPGNLYVSIPIPSCLNGQRYTPKYLVIHATNLTNPNSIVFGLKEDTAMLPTASIGTGVVKILSTGIYGGVRKTVTALAYKDLVFNSNPNSSNDEIMCRNGVNPNINIATCTIKIDRSY
jgi:hypothetical protein